MSGSLTLARPYARAAFELAQSRNALAVWSKQLGLAAQLSADPSLLLLLTNPKIALSDRVALLMPSEGPAEQSYADFLALLADNQRLSLLPQIAELYEQFRAEAERTLTVHVRSAAPIDMPQQQQLVGVLAKRFGRSVQLALEIDPELIGGAIIDAGSVVIDGSLRGKLKRMHNELMH